MRRTQIVVLAVLVIANLALLSEMTLADEPARPETFREQLYRRRMIESYVGPVIGVYPQRVTPELKERLGLDTEKGVMVLEIVAGTPAEKAGLKLDDVIIAINNDPTVEEDQLREAVRKASSADDRNDITIKAMRGKQEMEFRAIIREARQSPPQLVAPSAGRIEREWTGANDTFFLPGGKLIQEVERGRKELEQRAKEILGVYPETVTPELKLRLNLGTDKGVLVTDVVPEWPASKAGLNIGDVITAINGQAVNSEGELREAIRRSVFTVGDKEVAVKAMRGKREMEVNVKPSAEAFWQIPGMLPGRPGEYPPYTRTVTPEELEKLERERYEEKLKPQQDREKIRREILKKFMERKKESQKRESPP